MTQPELYPIFSNPKHINEQTDTEFVKGIVSQFPIENGKFRIELSNVFVDKKDPKSYDEKDAILRSKSLTYPIRGDISMVDKESGKVVDVKKAASLADCFHITTKHTIVYGGNNYVVANLLQLLPGVYTRRQENGELESHFNTDKGQSFTLILNPEEGILYLTVKGSNTELAPLLKLVFNLSDAEITKYVPKEIWLKNLQVTGGKEDKILFRQYSRLVNRSLQKPNPSREEMVSALRASLEKSVLHAGTTTLTLSKPIEHVTGEALLLALGNLIQVYKGDRAEDNRDSLAFKRVQNLPDFLRTRFEKEHESISKVANKIKFNLNRAGDNARLEGVVPTKPFAKIFSSYIMDSPLVSTPAETNPIESLENVGKVTVLGKGEGGISSDRAVPMSARNIDASHLGIIDPSRTPESGNAGIDQRFTMTAHRDRAGNLYAMVLDNTGKEVKIPVAEMVSTVVGLPHQDGKNIVQAQVNGKLTEVPRSKVKYWIADASHLYTVTTNLVPFLNCNHPGRLTMAGKAIPQALSLVNRENPLVQTTNSKDIPFVEAFGKHISQRAPANGTVVTMTSSGMVIKGDDGQKYEIGYIKNLPYNMKGFFDSETPLVKVGDKVKKGQVLVDNNYTRDGKLSLGKNLTVAYVPWKGFNHEDGIVISHSASKQLSSHHAYKYNYGITETSVCKKALINRYFPGKLTMEQLAKLDDNGFAHVGVKLEAGDPVIAVLEKREPTPEDKMLGRLHKTLVSPYRLVLDTWDGPENAEVVDAHTASKECMIFVRSIKQLEIGDKLTGLHGNKGVVSLIVDDADMPYDKETGKPVDLLLNPASVTSRINLGQIMETVAGKIARKTGKPYLVHNYGTEGVVRSLQKELKEHGLSDTSTIVDPKTGKESSGVLTGEQYILKLYKTTKDSYSARNVGGYDKNMQPTKGGEEGSKAAGLMEIYGMIGNNARHNLREMVTLKSEENSEHWAKFLTGQPLPKPKTTFATQKFLSYLQGSGINVVNKGDRLMAMPLTDHDILTQSNGAIAAPLMINSRNMEPEVGGLFDPNTTGGFKGRHWTHYSLAESVVNPTFEGAVKSLLDITEKEFEGIHFGIMGIKKHSNGMYGLYNSADGKLIRELKHK